MKNERCFTTALVSILLVGLASAAPAQQAIFLIRHAEKAEDGTDPPLSTEEGTRLRYGTP
ncbi:MAG: hypothetical protein WKF75_14820 [Singulisphaera sp.]